jgi:hypothetical protein
MVLKLHNPNSENLVTETWTFAQEGISVALLCSSHQDCVGSAAYQRTEKHHLQPISDSEFSAISDFYRAAGPTNAEMRSNGNGL